MKPLQINAYVPESVFTEGKEKLPCGPFYEDLILFHPTDGNRILAARGIFLHTGDRLPLSDQDADFLTQSINEASPVSIGSPPRIFLSVGKHALLVFTDLLTSCGLLVAILPHEDIGLVSQTLPYLMRENDLISPTLSNLSKSCGSVTDCYAHLSSEIKQCTHLLSPDQSTDFRLHAARLAEWAGSLANVISLPVGNFPLSDASMKRWSALLLSLFLILRGDSATPTKLDLLHADKQEFHLCLSHKPEAKRKIPLENRLESLLALPCFSSVRLIRTKRGLSLEIRLPRRHGMLLHADPFESNGMNVLIEILLT